MRQTSLRLPAVHGPLGRRDMGSYSLARAVVEGQLVTVYHNWVAFIWIEEIVTGFRGSHEHAPTETAWVDVINVGNSRSGQAISLTRLLDACLGSRAIIAHAPCPVADVAETCANVDATAAVTPFAPTTGLEVGVRRFVTWFRQWEGAAPAIRTA